MNSFIENIKGWVEMINNSILSNRHLTAIFSDNYVLSVLKEKANKQLGELLEKYSLIKIQRYVSEN